MEMPGEIVHPLVYNRVTHSVDDAVDVGAGHCFALARTLDPFVEELP